MVVVVPEHGGALKGDRCGYLVHVISLARLSERVPVGEILRHEGTIRARFIDQRGNFAISDLVVRVLDGGFLRR